MQINVIRFPRERTRAARTAAALERLEALLRFYHETKLERRRIFRRDQAST